MKKILITGGAGFIGSHITDKLVENGQKVTVYDNLSKGFRESVNPKAKLVVGSLNELVKPVQKYFCFLV